ncbi:gliding motility-associated C-terminal domain-containing protein [Zeaxanthinibacter sp. PT1]|uniref:T9SS type B sorting domain-containing protein n=1 Tax=Zeaxanthinibacter TaxID=561554 RepID=UPI002349079C|nr:gliding motility-associated C-terminal domain-containing protein [Zeaxanthinibacter sp. PT1]MDC6350625.1 gliding motility-associated C-terminal domain-containing protein [Zeaxanthinibacter sp. PT1]
MNAQEGQPAAFEIDAEIISGNRTIGMDDWFPGESGQGVISLDQLFSFQSNISKKKNRAFEALMRFPNGSVQNGRIWLEGRYGHDHVASGGWDDDTVFDESQGHNPKNWKADSNGLPDKTDIQDTYMHIRREGTGLKDSLWIVGAVSTIDNGGTHYIDVEFLIDQLQLKGNNFKTSAPDDGHTSWKFDGAGNIIQTGDLTVGLNFTASTIVNLEVWIWVSLTDYLSNRGFGYIDYVSASPGSTFGYAMIDIGSAGFTGINNNFTDAPPWGVFDSKAEPTYAYAPELLTEFGINLSKLGLDPVMNFPGVGLCDFQFKTVLFKSRISNSMRSVLRDFAGPYQLKEAEEAPPADNTIIPPGNFQSCLTDETLTLKAAVNEADAIYQWQAVSPGVSFPGGERILLGIGLNEVQINSPGEYNLVISQSGVCANEPNPPYSIAIGAEPCARDDDYLVQMEESQVFEVWENDLDLEGDLDQNSVTTTGLLQPSNGTVDIAGTGEITYTPNSGYKGPDSFEYRICDANGLCDTATVRLEIIDPIPPPFLDSDADGIFDKDDLDDDNDGIPDTEEQGVIMDRNQPACGGETPLDFSNDAILISGTDKQKGAVYRVSEVSPGVDALITISDIYNATITAIDFNDTDPHAFRPESAFSFKDAGDQGLIEYKIRFVKSNSFSPVVIDNFFMNFNDIDGTPQYAEQTWADKPTNYVLSDPTELSMYSDGKWIVGTSGTKTYGGASNANPQTNFGVHYTSKSEMTVRVGAMARVAGAKSLRRLHHIEFLCVTNYINPVRYMMDADFDGVPNHLDLDSDNDGIFDAVEAGHGVDHTRGILNGSFGDNGMADTVETTNDSGILNYTLSDSDAAGLMDYLENDSDSDGCSDANEAHFKTDADGGDNPFYGTGSPPLINTDGTVRFAPYRLPLDNDANGIYDFREATAPTITRHPENQISCKGENVIFSVEADQASQYQWQVFDGDAWTNLVNDTIYQGTDTDSLQILNAPLNLNGKSFRALMSGASFVCDINSNPATLNLQPGPEVKANASSLSISSGDFVTLTGTGAESYTWDHGITDGEPIQLFATTTFTVTGIGADGCTNTDSTTIEVNALSDLELGKSADNTTPNVGDEITFTITVTNHGPDKATNVRILDNIPIGFIPVSAANNGTISGNKIEWSLAEVAVGQQQLTYKARVNPPTGTAGEFRNMVQVTALDQQDPDSDPKNDDGDQSEDDEAQFTIPTPTADLMLTKTIDKNEATVGELVVFTISVRNQGPYSATGISISENIPAGYELLAATTTTGDYSQETSRWNISELLNGESATLVVEATVNPTGPYNNSVSIIELDQADTTPGDNSASSGIETVKSQADLELEKLVSKSDPNVGDTVVFTINIKNNGPDTATNVLLIDQLPPGLELISAPGAEIDENLIQWHIPEIPVGLKTLSYEVRVLPSTGLAGEYRNIAEIAATDQADPDSQPGNDDGDQDQDDEDGVALTVPMAKLVLTKEVETTEVRIGDSVTFTITLSNSGDREATNIVVQDELPSGYALESVIVSTGSFDSSSWSIPVLAPGLSATLTMIVQVTDGGDYENIAQITYADQLIDQGGQDMDTAIINFKEDCLVVYNEFSPNDDGLNDVLYIECIEQYPNSRLQVFDRWGSKVFDEPGYDNSWRGINKSKTSYDPEKELSTGTYYYILSLGDGKTPDRTGWLYISR